MSCPKQVRSHLIAILRIGVLRARAAAWENDAKRSAIETDHVHNVPDMLAEFEVEKLRYYLEAEKPAFERTASNTTEFGPHWVELAAYMKQEVVS